MNFNTLIKLQKSVDDSPTEGNIIIPSRILRELLDIARKSDDSNELINMKIQRIKNFISDAFINGYPDCIHEMGVKTCVECLDYIVSIPPEVSIEQALALERAMEEGFD